MKNVQKAKKSSGIIPAKLGRSLGGGKRLVQHPEVGIVDVVTGAGAMRCAGLWEAPADGWLLVFPISLIFLIWEGYAGVVTSLNPFPELGKGQG